MRFTETFIGKKLSEAHRLKSEKAYCLNNITQLTPMQIEDFFSWYTHAKRSFMFFDEASEGVLVNHHMIMNSIEFSYTLNGSEIVFMVTDDANSDRKIKYLINLSETTIKVYRYYTCTDFNKEYTAKMLRHKLLTKKSTPELFNTIKDFMAFCIKTRYSWCKDHKEDIHEAIPIYKFV